MNIRSNYIQPGRNGFPNSSYKAVKWVRFPMVVPNKISKGSAEEMEIIGGAI